MEEIPVKQPNSFLGRAMWKRPEVATDRGAIIDQLTQRVIIGTVWIMLDLGKQGTVKPYLNRLEGLKVTIVAAGRDLTPDAEIGSNHFLPTARRVLTQQIDGEVWLSELSACNLEKVLSSYDWMLAEKATLKVWERYCHDLEGERVEEANSNN